MIRLLNKVSYRAIGLQLSLLVGTVAFVAIGFEVYLRISYPYLHSFRPGFLHSPCGILYRPGEDVYWTNYIEYGHPKRANSLGFVDREHAVYPDKDTVSVVVLGDSYVESLHLSEYRQFTAILEGKLQRRFPDKRVQVVALGHSSSGACRYKCFFDYLGAQYSPDLVLVNHYTNDILDDSVLLKAIDSNWHPYKAPRYQVDVVDGNILELPANSHFFDSTPPVDKLVASQPTASLTQTVRSPGRAWRRLLWSTRTYWYFRHLWPRVFPDRTGSGMKRRLDLLAQRVDALRSLDPSFATRLEDFRFPNDDFGPNLLRVENPPRVVQEGYASTRYCLSAIRDAAARTGAKMLMSVWNKPVAARQSRYGRGAMSSTGATDLYAALARDLDVPFIDLYSDVAERIDPKAITFRYDPHWNARGHRLIAEILDERLASFGIPAD